MRSITSCARWSACRSSRLRSVMLSCVNSCPYCHGRNNIGLVDHNYDYAPVLVGFQYLAPSPPATITRHASAGEEHAALRLNPIQHATSFATVAKSAALLRSLHSQRKYRPNSDRNRGAHPRPLAVYEKSGTLAYVRACNRPRLRALLQEERRARSQLVWVDIVHEAMPADSLVSTLC